MAIASVRSDMRAQSNNLTSRSYDGMGLAYILVMVIHKDWSSDRNAPVFRLHPPCSEEGKSYLTTKQKAEKLIKELRELACKLRVRREHRQDASGGTHGER